MIGCQGSLVLQKILNIAGVVSTSLLIKETEDYNYYMIII